MSDLMRELLDEVERLQGELRAQLAPLRDGLQRLTGLESLEEDVARLEGVALDLLRQAEMEEDQARLEATLRSVEPLHDRVARELGALTERLQGVLAEALGEATAASRGINQMINEATSDLVQKRTSLEVVMGRARAALDARALEETRVAEEPTDGGEETRIAAEFTDGEATDERPAEPDEAPPPEVVSYEETRAFEEGGLVPEMPDRRRHPRAEMVVEVRLEGSDETLAGITENIGVGGLFIATSHRVELGTLLHVSCALPDGHIVRADGLVSWFREETDEADPGIGVEFVALSEQDRELLLERQGTTS